MILRGAKSELPRFNRRGHTPVFFAAAAKSLQSCPTLCNPIDGSPPGSPSLGFSRQEHWSELPFPPMHESEVTRVQLLATPWTVAHQAPPSMGFSRQEYWSGLPLPCPNVVAYVWLNIIDISLSFVLLRVFIFPSSFCSS